MVQDKDTRSSIVIIEAGAGWPTWIADYQRQAPNAAVVAGAATDSIEEFRERVARRLLEFERQRQPLHAGILLCEENEDSERGVARRDIGRDIVNALDPRGELVLAASEDCNERFKHELVALAGELCEVRAGTRVNVRARFAPKKSGTMPSVVPVARVAAREAAGNE